MSFIWATRGRSWGFRFLRGGGFTDPLPAYDEAFAYIGDEPEVHRRIGDTVALRLLDPLGRRDEFGRVIPHEFVVLGELAHTIDSVDDGLAQIWPLVEDEYAQLWDSPTPVSQE